MLPDRSRVEVGALTGSKNAYRVKTRVFCHKGTAKETLTGGSPAGKDNLTDGKAAGRGHGHRNEFHVVSARLYFSLPLLSSFRSTAAQEIRKHGGEEGKNPQGARDQRDSH